MKYFYFKDELSSFQGFNIFISRMEIADCDESLPPGYKVVGKPFSKKLERILTEKA